MTKRFQKILSAFLVIAMVIVVLPTSVFAACLHSYTKVYTMENADMHSYVSKCTNCGTVTEGWGYSGWLDHTFNSYGECSLCGFCNHSNNRKVYTYENNNMHSYYSICNGCGKTLDGYGYAGWSNHSYSGNTCVNCGFSKVCSHTSKAKSYMDYSSSQHKVNSVCNNCGIICSTTTASHSWTYGSWSPESDTKHTRDRSCVCGRETSEVASHSFNGNLCSGCGYRKSQTPVVNASVSLSASGPNGILGPGGGEITAEEIPASYTVYASTSNCEVTRISYVMNGKTHTVYDSSVTIKANSLSEFQTTTFTAYTNVSGVTATFTVNFKYVSYNTAYIMWETFEEATIRSITGNGLNKTLNYTMDLENSYTTQGNLSEAQRETLQSLIGRSDGKTYMIKYTRMISVYTPASMSSTGEKVVHGTFDGNVPSEIETCVNTWGWGSDTKEAIRQAASSSLSFTTSMPVDCEAVWIDTNTGIQIYSTTSFSGISSVTPNQAGIVSVSYSDYPDSDSYVYESLIYSGDTSGTSTSETYSQTYTVNSKQLRVTFYCHSIATTGSITVMAIDADTQELISTARVTCDGVKGSGNPYTFTDLQFGSYKVTATSSGYTAENGTVTVSSSAPTKTVELKLYKIEGEITVVVKDSKTHEPIEDAYVSDMYIRGSTNSNGSVSFSGLDYGDYTFVVSKERYYTNTGSTNVTAYNRSVSITVYLDPMPEVGDVGVTVIDCSTDEPIYGATVSGPGDSDRKTDKNGYTQFTDIPFGRYEIIATKDGYISSTEEAWLDYDSTSDNIIIYLEPLPISGDITVNVCDAETGDGITDAKVTVGNVSNATDSNGQVVFSSLAFDTYVITALADGYESTSKKCSINTENTNAVITIYLIKQKTDITIDSEIKGDIYKGSTIIVSATVTNNGEVNLTPSMPATVTMIATRNDGTVFDEQTAAVIIPANDSNLVWFTVNIPEDGYTSDTITFDFDVVAPTGITETDTNNNSVSVSKDIDNLPVRDCEDSGFITEVPSLFEYSQYDGHTSDTLTWDVYEWDEGFVLKTYTAKLILNASLMPNESAGYRMQNGDIWITRSGYGIDTEVQTLVDTQSADIIGELKVDVFYPEHNYSTSESNSDRLELIENTYVFKINTSSISESRMHGIPLWFPDGAYAAKYYAYDLWCPAGMLSGYTNAYVIIEGDMYDDLYTN